MKVSLDSIFENLTSKGKSFHCAYQMRKDQLTHKQTKNDKISHVQGASCL